MEKWWVNMLGELYTRQSQKNRRKKNNKNTRIHANMYIVISNSNISSWNPYYPVAALSLTVCTTRSKLISQSIPYNPHSCGGGICSVLLPIHKYIYGHVYYYYTYIEEAAAVAMTFFSTAPLRRPRRRFNSVPRCAHLWAPRVRL